MKSDRSLNHLRKISCAMTASTSSDQELLTEHFGYPPVVSTTPISSGLSLIDDIINSVNILAERALNSVEQGLLNAPPAALGFKPAKRKAGDEDGNGNGSGGDALAPADAARAEIEAGTHQLETLLCASVDRNFDKFEIYVLRNIFCVRPPALRDWMRLSHYEGLDFSHATTSAPPASSSSRGDDSAAVAAAAAAQEEDPDRPTVASVNRLRARLRESMRLNALLTAERARNERALDELRALVGLPGPAVKAESTTPSANASPAAAGVGAGEPPRGAPRAADVDGPFAFLHRQRADLAAGSGSDAPVSTTAAFALSQMSALRALSASLRRVTPDLVPSASSLGSDDDDDDDDDKDVDEDEDEGGDGKKKDGRRKNDKKKKKKSWRRERAEYVEGAARRHLEAVQGLELGRDGAVRDGEWQGPGRGPARGEVERLERVVAVLGGGDDSDSDRDRKGGHHQPSSAAGAAVAADEAEGPDERGGEPDSEAMDES
ncbi:Mis12 protein-domain-containing protein [Xylariaceae sp. FL0804]|nr:Mis12 protein-domain-containing protein [Xylariaceae sp. FL0804]